MATFFISKGISSHESYTLLDQREIIRLHLVRRLNFKKRQLYKKVFPNHFKGKYFTPWALTLTLSSEPGLRDLLQPNRSMWPDRTKRLMCQGSDPPNGTPNRRVPILSTKAVGWLIRLCRQPPTMHTAAALQHRHIASCQSGCAS